MLFVSCYDFGPIGHKSDNKKPDNGGVSAEKYYHISNGNYSSGYININTEMAKAGSIITVWAYPYDGFTLNSISIEKSNRENVGYNKIDDNTFTFQMPASDVTVWATFLEIPWYNIQINESSYGYINTSLTSARAGEMIYLYIAPYNYNYYVDSIYIYAGGSNIGCNYVDTNTYTFYMPQDNVSIEVYFRQY